MSDTGISEQIATLREQIAAAEVEIENQRARLKAQSVSDGAAGEAPLTELIEARDSMLNRMSRLESCQRGFGP
jgi:hypothetical protein